MFPSAFVVLRVVGKSRRKTTVWCSLGASLLTLPILMLPAQLASAQPVQASPQQADAKALEAVRAQVAKVRKTDPQAALKLLEEFLEAHPDADLGTRNAALKEQSSVLFDDLKDAERALAVTDLIIENARLSVKNGAPETTLVLAQITQGRIGILSHQPAKVEALFDTPESWSRMVKMMDTSDRLQLSVASAATNLLFTALQDQKKYALIVRKVEELMQSAPALLVGINQSLTENMAMRLAGNLAGAGQSEAGLSWAKYAYQQANFDTKSIAACTKQLISAWAANDDLDAIRAFSKAQQEAAPAIAPPAGATPETAATAPTIAAALFPDPNNPLTKVKAPELVTQSRDLLLKMVGPLQGSTSYDRQHDLVSVYIALGAWKSAMQTARGIWQSDPQNPRGAMEICRVFKAADLSTVRANNFLAYLQGQVEGVNPVKQFSQEHQADA